MHLTKIGALVALAFVVTSCASGERVSSDSPASEHSKSEADDSSTSEPSEAVTDGESLPMDQFKDTITVRGTVTYPDGTSVPEAIIAFRCWYVKGDEVKGRDVGPFGTQWPESDERGRFEVEINLFRSNADAVARFAVHAMLADYYPRHYVDLNLDQRHEYDDIVVEVPRPSSIRGVVVNEDGKPVRGLTLNLYAPEDHKDGAGSMWTVQSDSQGQFKFAPLEAAAYRMFQHYPSTYLEGPVEIEVDAETNHELPSPVVARGTTLLQVTLSKEGVPREQHEDRPVTLKLYQADQLVASKRIERVWLRSAIWPEPPTGDFDLVVSCDGYDDSEPKPVSIRKNGVARVWLVSLNKSEE